MGGRAPLSLVCVCERLMVLQHVVLYREGDPGGARSAPVKDSPERDRRASQRATFGRDPRRVSAYPSRAARRGTPNPVAGGEVSEPGPAAAPAANGEASPAPRGGVARTRQGRCGRRTPTQSRALTCIGPNPRPTGAGGDPPSEAAAARPRRAATGRARIEPMRAPTSAARTVVRSVSTRTASERPARRVRHS